MVWGGLEETRGAEAIINQSNHGARCSMAATSGEANQKVERPRGIRLAILAGVVIVVFVAGVGVGVLLSTSGLPVIRVSPVIAIIGDEAQNTSTSSSCVGASQSSFDGYFDCAVTVACSQSGPGNFIVQNASAPAASNLVVTPTLPRNLPCSSSDSFRIAGELGYSGSVTIYLDIF